MNTPVALRGNGADAAAGASSFDELASRWAGGDDLDALVEALVAEMSDAEKLRLIGGDVDFWEGRLRTLQEGSNTHPPQAARCSRLEIPRIAFVEPLTILCQSNSCSCEEFSSSRSTDQSSQRIQSP